MTRIVRLDPERPLGGQPGVGHNRWHPGLDPVLVVAPGETFTLETIDSSDAFLHASSTPDDVLRFPLGRVHPLTGPVAVEGAAPGMEIEIEILDVEPRGPAISSLGPGDGLLGDVLDAPRLDVWTTGGDGYARTPGLPGVRVAARPFPGTIGVAPGPAELGAWRSLGAAPDAPEDAVPPSARNGLRSLPPWPSGGNIDVPTLVRGSRLVLPVLAPGALVSVGDLHVAQGAGELGATAIETAGAVTLRCLLRDGTAPRAPYAIVPARSRGTALTTVGLPCGRDGRLVPDDLRLAARSAALALVEIVADRMGLEMSAAITLASVAADLEIAQLVNDPYPTVTCTIPLDVFDDSAMVECGVERA